MIIYTALGDSITAGASASSPFLAYPSLICKLLRSKRGLNVIANVLAEPGWTSEALLTSVLQTPATILKKSSSISIWIGGDDLITAGVSLLQGAPETIIQDTLKTYERNLAKLVNTIRNVSSGRIIVCSQYNPFPNSPLAVEAIAALNQVIHLTAGRFHLSLAPVDAWFSGNLETWIAGYKRGRLEDILTSKSPPIHPNNDGHRVIAEGLIPFLI
ncbi:SGNH/GDSL hydrolase family protein [Fodinisporobacter ferrooxydans]|uniref:SGNH/GDSL hydrolase family protein n=1 Tax=Fodinisporobacter ferrooxydans TaxID=2901836 RepID=A0ABY4CPA8_9BACL|nr:SGNH/GDSL hydrolase family protein [Alicyclobacillaceae bacterium MYW30-H2]